MRMPSAARGNPSLSLLDGACAVGRAAGLRGVAATTQIVRKKEEEEAADQEEEGKEGARAYTRKRTRGWSRKSIYAREENSLENQSALFSHNHPFLLFFFLLLFLRKIIITTINSKNKIKQKRPYCI